MTKRRIKLDQYNISKFAYDELSAFCKQYPEKKQKLTEMRNPLKAQQLLFPVREMLQFTQHKKYIN